MYTRSFSTETNRSGAEIALRSSLVAGGVAGVTGVISNGSAPTRHLPAGMTKPGCHQTSKLGQKAGGDRNKQKM
jgi:hypothetical protein